MSLQCSSLTPCQFQMLCYHVRRSSQEKNDFEFYRVIQKIMSYDIFNRESPRHPYFPLKPEYQRVGGQDWQSFFDRHFSLAQEKIGADMKSFLELGNLATNELPAWRLQQIVFDMEHLQLPRKLKFFAESREIRESAESLLKKVIVKENLTRQLEGVVDAESICGDVLDLILDLTNVNTTKSALEDPVNFKRRFYLGTISQVCKAWNHWAEAHPLKTYLSQLGLLGDYFAKDHKGLNKKKCCVIGPQIWKDCFGSELLESMGMSVEGCRPLNWGDAGFVFQNAKFSGDVFRLIILWPKGFRSRDLGCLAHKSGISFVGNAEGDLEKYFDDQTEPLVADRPHWIAAHFGSSTCRYGGSGTEYAYSFQSGPAEYSFETFGHLQKDMKEMWWEMVNPQVLSILGFFGSRLGLDAPSESDKAGWFEGDEERLLSRNLCGVVKGFFNYSAFQYENKISVVFQYAVGRKYNFNIQPFHEMKGTRSFGAQRELPDPN